ncbi:MAG: hypothetical protein ACI9SP_001972 [Arenicella sp.]|jgi:hypothetical protein
MQLNTLIIEPRLRTAWSSIDLGLVLGRMFWLRGFCLYLVVAIPVFALTRLIDDSYSMLPYFILWWCKPLFERPILFFMSRELFSNKTSFSQTLGHFREWLFSGIGWVLSIRRLSISRAMYAPITLLEKPSFGQYSQRAAVLGNKFSSESVWLTIVLFHVENFISISLLVVFVMFFPEQVDVSLAWLNDLRLNNSYLDAAFLLVMAAIAPFYVAAGFMLYISRRVELEGWDIEICFRDWMADYKGRSNTELVSHEV